MALRCCDGIAFKAKSCLEKGYSLAQSQIDEKSVFIEKLKQDIYNLYENEHQLQSQIQEKEKRIKELEEVLKSYPGIYAMQFESEKMVQWVQKLDNALHPTTESPKNKQP